MTLRLCGKQNAYSTGSLQKSRRPQSAQKSRTLLRLSLRESSSRGALRLLRSSRYALTRPDRFAAGASRSSGNLTASPQVYFARRNRIARQAVRQVTDRLSKHRSQSCACAHAASCDRFAAQSLRSFGQPDAFGAGASFAPIPAPVKLAEPKYALRPSTMIHLKCTRGQSIRSIPRHRSG